MSDMLATLPDLAAWTQREIDDAAGTIALETATGWIQSEIGQRIVHVVDDTVTLRGGYPSLWLPERPVIEVGDVTTTDKRGTVTERTLNTHYYVVGAELRYAGCYWPELVTVTYSHGYPYPVIPQALRGVCLSAASRVYSNSSSMRSVTIDDVSWTSALSAQDIGPGLTGAERDSLAQFRLISVA